MRVLLILLLLVNLGYFAWATWIREPVPEAGGARRDAPRLVLGREAPPPVPGATRPQRPGEHCLSLGPFGDLTDAARASTLLREHGLRPRQRAGEGTVWKGYWVSLEQLPDRPAAEGIIERLRRFGVGDAYVLPEEDNGITISLGLFSERQRALRRMDEVRALGLEPQLAERERSGTVYWIDVDVEPPARLPDTTALDDGSGRILRLAVQPCDESAIGSRPVPEVAQSRALPG